MFDFMNLTCRLRIHKSSVNACRISSCRDEAFVLVSLCSRGDTFLLIEGGVCVIISLCKCLKLSLFGVLGVESCVKPVFTCVKMCIYCDYKICRYQVIADLYLRVF